MKVYIADIGCITPGCFGKSPQFVDLKIGEKQWTGWSIDRDFLYSNDFESKALMSLHTQLSLLAFSESLKSISKKLFENEKGQIVAGHGHISLDDLTIKAINKYLLRADKPDFQFLGENIDRMPPLDGIKMLSTASTHFIAKILKIHEMGNQIYSGLNSSLNAVVESFYAIKNQIADFVIVISAEAPFYKNSFLKAYGFIEQDLPYAEGGFATIIVSEKMVNKYPITPLAQIHQASTWTIPNVEDPLRGFNSNQFKKHYDYFSKEKASPIFISRFAEKIFNVPTSEKVFQAPSLVEEYFFGASTGIANLLSLISHEECKENRVLTALGTGGHVSSIAFQGV